MDVRSSYGLYARCIMQAGVHGQPKMVWSSAFEGAVIQNLRTLPSAAIRRFYVEQQPLRTTSSYEQLRANWAECVRFGGGNLVAPQSAEELSAVVRRARRCRVVGSGHSFSAIVDTPDAAGSGSFNGDGGDDSSNTLISLAHLSHVHGIDADRMTVTVDGGATLGTVCRYLAQRGAALSNLPSFPQLTVGGALATATHGSGRRHRNLASQVAALELVVADGTVRRFERGVARSHACSGLEDVVIGLGCLGVASRVELDIVPAYDIANSVYTNLPFDAYLDAFDDLHDPAHCDSIAAFVNFGAAGGDGIVDGLFVRHYVKHQEGGDGASGTQLRESHRPKLPLLSGAVSSDARIPFFESHEWREGSGTYPWHAGLMYFIGRDGRDVPMEHLVLQAEFFVDIADAAAALRATRDVAQNWPGWGLWDGDTPESAGVCLAAELRVVAGDDFSMSPHHGRDSLGIHFTFGPQIDPVLALVAELEKALAPFAPRPHWGKLFCASAEQVRETHAKTFGTFAQRCLDHDPHGKFRQQPWLKHHLLSGSALDR